MKNYLYGILFASIVLLAGCGRTPLVKTEPNPDPTPTLGDPGVNVVHAPDARAAARAYLDSWKSEDYSSMYKMLAPLSLEAIEEDDFMQEYHSVAAEAALSSVDYEIHSVLTNPRNAQVSYRITMHSALVGDIQADTVMNLSLEDDRWRVKWEEGLILPQLSGGNYLRMDYDIPSRANIYDSSGHALVAQSDAVALGIDTSQMDPEQENHLLDVLFELTGIRQETLRPQLENYRNFGWYLPVADLSSEVASSREGILSGLAGLVMQPFRTRYHFDGGVAPHVVGYMSAIQEDEVDKYRRLGYRWNERVGRAGLELWGEPHLAGKRGGSLRLVNSDGIIVTNLATTSPQPSEAIYTTLDKDFQRQVQQAIAGFRGAIVVLERDTGRVLAIASSPSFNPNLFEPTNFNSQQLLSTLYGDERPLLNRATQGQYPLGSVFKIVTMAAALESGLYRPETEYTCGYFFEELQGVRLNDWTYEHFLQDGKTQPSGLLTLLEGLMRSCNPFFWHIGLDFYNQGMTATIADMARGFGLGSKTGINGISTFEEEAGQIPVPSSPVIATNLAIGQGESLITPIQVASFVAAIGNGGSLLQPNLIERIVPPSGDPTYVFTPTVSSSLPISDQNLSVIQEAMVSVVADRRGTAWHRFTNLGIRIGGKTGTAESGSGKPHAWFAGYTFEGSANRPDIAGVVLVENVGEGSDYAAPIFRRVLEIYYYGQPLTLYPWEAQFGVSRTATPQVTETPAQEPTPTEEATPEP